MKTYQVRQERIYMDEFDESDIPEGVSADEYAESRYRDGMGDLEDHKLAIEEVGPKRYYAEVTVTYSFEFDDDDIQEGDAYDFARSEFDVQNQGFEFEKVEVREL